MRQPNSSETLAFFEAEGKELRRSVMADAELVEARRKAELAELQGKIKSSSGRPSVVGSDCCVGLFS